MATSDDKKYTCAYCARSYLGRIEVRGNLVWYETTRPTFGQPQRIMVCSLLVGKEAGYGKDCRDAAEAQGYRPQRPKKGEWRYV